MPPRPRLHEADAAPSRALDAAKSSLQHLQEQERMLTSKVLPAENPVDAAFKPPEPLPHSYVPRAPGSRNAAGAPVHLRVPKALDSIVGAPADGARPNANPELTASISYSKVRRWEALPKNAWLQAAESGHAPGPGYRDIAPTQTLRSFGPKKLDLTVPSVSELSLEMAPEVAKLGMSAVVGQNYTPSARGLVPATLMAMLKDGLPEVEEEDDEDDGELQTTNVLNSSAWLVRIFMLWRSVIELTSLRAH